MDACPDRAPLTIDQIRVRLAAEEEQSSAKRPNWRWLIAAGSIALGAAASLVLHASHRTTFIGARHPTSTAQAR